MSEANRVSVKYVPEVTYGVTPLNATTWQKLRFTSQNLAANPQSVVSNEIRADRMISDLIKVGEQVGGQLGFELSMETYDDLLEAVMYDTWTGNVLEVGTTESSFTLEVGYEDWSPVQYLQYKGMRVASCSLNFTYGAIVTGQFAFAGKEALAATLSLVGTGTVGAESVTDVVNGSGDVGSILIDGGAPGVIVKSISLNIDNGMRAIEGIGSVGPSDQAAGRANITGTIEIYFDSITLYNKLIANTAAAISWQVGDGVDTQTYLLPKVKFNDGVPAVTGVDTDVMLSLNFTALFDSVTGTSLRITRSA